MLSTWPYTHTAGTEQTLSLVWFCCVEEEEEMRLGGNLRGRNGEDGLDQNHEILKIANILNERIISNYIG